MSSPARYKPLANASAQQEPPTIAGLIKQLQPELARALPRHLDADRVARLALTVVRKTPKLAQCTPQSFAGALMTAAALGLEPGVNGEAWLVPYRNKDKGITECQLIVGYQGVVKHYWQSPLARGLDVQAVHEYDQFEYEYGLRPFLRHKPARGNRGAITDYYAIARLADSEPMFIVLSPEEIQELRLGKTGPNGDIPDPQHWMEKKTILKQLLKPLPKSTALHNVIDADGRDGAELYRAHLVENGIIDVEPEPPLTVAEGTPEGAEADPSGAVVAASSSQKRALYTAFRLADIHPLADRLAIANHFLGGGLESFNGLTAAQAGELDAELSDLSPEDLQALLAEINSADKPDTDPRNEVDTEQSSQGRAQPSDGADQ